MKLFLVFIISFSFIELLSAQESCISFNSKILDFESSKNEIQNEPILRASIGYSGIVDTLSFYSGSSSYRISGVDSANTKHASVEIKIPVRVNKNSNIFITGYVKTDSLIGKNSGALVRIMGYKTNNPIPVYFAYDDTILKDTNLWRSINFSSTITENIDYLVLNGTMQGKGTTWFDNFSISIDDKSLNTILESQAREVSVHELSLLESYSIGLDSITNDHIFFAKLSQLDESLKETKIIGLGEATHGTKEISMFKYLFFKYLVNNLDYKVLALEAPLPAAFALNEYIIHGKGNPVKLIANLEFWMYYNEAFLELVEWIKSYNDNHSDKVYFAGFDMQNNQSAISVIGERYRQNQTVTELLKEIQSDNLSFDVKMEISQRVKAEIIKTSKSKLLRRQSDILIQNSFLNKFQGWEYANVRDSLMAKNVLWLKDTMFKNKKIALWAHDSHIEKSDKRMGGLISKIYGDSYLNFGFLLNKGNYTAVDNVSSKLTSTNLLRKIACNSFENVLNKLDNSVIILNNKKASQNRGLEKLFYNGFYTKRSIGAVSQYYQFENLGNHISKLFDFLVYIENSHASCMLGD